MFLFVCALTSPSVKWAVATILFLRVPQGLARKQYRLSLGTAGQVPGVLLGSPAVGSVGRLCRQPPDSSALVVGLQDEIRQTLTLVWGLHEQQALCLRLPPL